MEQRATLEATWKTGEKAKGRQKARGEGLDTATQMGCLSSERRNGPD